MVQINKSDRPVGTTGPEESKKSESSVTSKPRSSKGIAESESKFETAKPNSLFQSSAYSTVRSSEQKNENLVRNLKPERHTNSSSSTTASTPEASTTPASQDQQTSTTTITDGTSNTISFGEQSTEPAQEQSHTTTITDGTSNTILVGEQQSSESTPEQSTNPPSQDQTAGTPVLSRDDVTTRERQAPVVVIGGSNTNVQNGSGESSQETSTIPSSQEQQPVTEKDGSTTIGTGGEAQQGITVTLGDGSSRTIEPEGQSTESSQETSTGQQSDTTIDESTSTSTTETTDGTSNTITVES